MPWTWRRVIELVPRVELRAIPHAPAFLAGLLGYRGEVVPVIDLGLLLGSSPCPDRLSTRIILVKSAPGGQNRGDETRDRGPGTGATPRPDRRAGQRPGRGRAEQVVPAPVHLPQAPYLDAIARTDRGFVPMIAVAKLASVLVTASDRVGEVRPVEPSRAEAREADDQ